ETCLWINQKDISKENFQTTLNGETIKTKVVLIQKKNCINPLWLWDMQDQSSCFEPFTEQWSLHIDNLWTSSSKDVCLLDINNEHDGLLFFKEVFRVILEGSLYVLSTEEVRYKEIHKVFLTTIYVDTFMMKFIVYLFNKPFIGQRPLHHFLFMNMIAKEAAFMKIDGIYDHQSIHMLLQKQVMYLLINKNSLSFFLHFIIIILYKIFLNF
ncbi:hypothetical protein ACJX0J_023943, partial [Zea mays]